MTPLEGNLKEFRVPEIIQLLSQSGKTGTLRVASKLGGFIYLNRGQVFFAATTRGRKPLGQRLKERGTVNEANLGKALEIQKKEEFKRRLGQILISIGCLDKKTLNAFIEEQIWAELCEIITWSEGSFSFFSNEMPTQEDVGIYIEEWEKSRRSLPKFEAAFAKARDEKILPAVPPGTIFALDETSQAKDLETTLDPDEQKLLKFIDGHRSEKELAQLSGLSNSQARYCLYKLSHLGLIKVVRRPLAKEAKKPTKLPSAPPEKATTIPPTRKTPPLGTKARFLGDVMLQTEKGEKKTSSYAVKIGEKSTIVLLSSSGKYTFNRELTPEEKRHAIEEIQRTIKETQP